ncbi:hypothetical protein P153DRAFT_118782 [Dothidotthia symphoricarpi CBS 119687]|uniref:Uncharacterized protein n=1 Tax=Dothidotthia symphoricarpi CBS 119687 TaxID=1392245 RepID=A0A6A5ZZS7_9PLEO|nr:uncharacterized protein P153DRAFT_118782 [Dothidotthia symphoricarpi CBS 119687]KAF2125050.1 hypothetical protein P153DRAFT_118782 [Dothidotthia symphoricarpi CBS 119687]
MIGIDAATTLRRSRDRSRFSGPYPHACFPSRIRFSRTLKRFSSLEAHGQCGWICGVADLASTKETWLGLVSQIGREGPLSGHSRSARYQHVNSLVPPWDRASRPQYSVQICCVLRVARQNPSFSRSLRSRHVANAAVNSGVLRSSWRSPVLSRRDACWLIWQWKSHNIDQHERHTVSTRLSSIIGWERQQKAELSYACRHSKPFSQQSLGFEHCSQKCALNP